MKRVYKPWLLNSCLAKLHCQDFKSRNHFLSTEETQLQGPTLSRLQDDDEWVRHRLLSEYLFQHLFLLKTKINSPFTSLESILRTWDKQFIPQQDLDFSWIFQITSKIKEMEVKIWVLLRKGAVLLLLEGLLPSSEPLQISYWLECKQIAYY